MELADLFDELAIAARAVDIEVRVEPYGAAFPDGRAARGGLCKVRGRRRVVIDEAAPLPDRIAVLAAALARIDLASVDLLPVVRATIAAHGPGGAPGKAAAPPRPLARARPRDDD